MPTATQQLVKEAIKNGEDFEFYPTTDEIIETVMKDWEISVHDRRSPGSSSSTIKVMDIGAGSGKVLDAFLALKAKNEWYCKMHTLAVEKSQTLIRHLVKSHRVVGTDFYHQTFMALETDVVFCNPPYKDYEAWICKILSTINTRLMYLVIPSRWKNNKEIQRALQRRGDTAKVLGSFDFLESEDRKARAHVDIVRIESDVTSDSLFNNFFQDRFGDLIESAEKADEKRAKQEKEEQQRKSDLVPRYGLAHALVILYDEELTRIRENYQKAASLDVELLQDIGTSLHNIIEHLYTRMTTLRVFYWRKIFEQMPEIRLRLTEKNRNEMKSLFEECEQIDFTLPNILAVVCWIVEHANSYTDSQIVEVFDHMVGDANITNYKSNAKVYKSNKWGYFRETPEKIKLNYRLVLGWGGINNGKTFRCDKDRITLQAAEKMNDLMVMCRCLGFHGDPNDVRLSHYGHYLEEKDSIGRQKHTVYRWSSGKSEVFYDNEGQVMFEVKCFYNGNMHVRLAGHIALALNVAAGKLKGWIFTADQAAEELQDRKAAAVFNQSVRLGTESLPLLCGPVAA